MTNHDLTELMTAEGEIIPTSQLNTGDVIRVHGCLMQIEALDERDDSTNQNAFGLVRWSAATLLHRADSSSIPKGWLSCGPNNSLTWQVQGNDLATWCRVRNA